MQQEEAVALINEADVFIHHFTGWEEGLEDNTKPSAFRNICTYYDHVRNRFWTAPQYNAISYDRYKLLASSHIGALDFMPTDRFRWLPDLLPLDGAYSFNPDVRPYPAVSYIKHADELRIMDFRDVVHLDCSRTAHTEVLAKRRSLASVVIDNVCDGHYGLAGQEAVILGLPVFVFNHERTSKIMDGWCKKGTIYPFCYTDSVQDAAEMAVLMAKRKISEQQEIRFGIRKWAEEFLAPQHLISEYWDPFVEELAS